MNKYVLLIISLVVFTSCGADQATVDKMTVDMCEALKGIDTGDISSLMDAATAMTEVLAKDEGYESVTQAQLESAMQEKCPDSWKVLEELMAMGE